MSFPQNKINFLDCFCIVFFLSPRFLDLALNCVLSVLAPLAVVAAVVVVAVAVVGAAAVVNLKDGVAGNISALTTFPAF